VAWADELMAREWGTRWQARRGELVDVLDAEGLVVGDRDGMATYRVNDGASELLWIVAMEPGRGVGTQLVDALPPMRTHVTTTNDNIDALGFYQRRGFRLHEVRVGAVDDARARLKPAIGLVGFHGIEIHDEIELVRR
jgi:GNAT superfamily N-acetyltransferase